MVPKSGSKSRLATFSEAAAMVVRRACGARGLPVLIHHIIYSTRAGWDRYGWMCFFRSICSSLQDAPVCFLFCFPHTTHPCLAMLADEDVADAASPEPSESSVDDDFWRHVDTIFAALADADGEEDGNLFWVQRPRENTDFKLVLQASQVRECTVRAMILLLDESPFIGGKVMVSSDTLIILYLRGDFALDQDLLHGIVECCDAVPFLPYNCTTTDPRLIWLGNSNESDSFCQPIY